MDKWLRGCDLSHWNNDEVYNHVFNFADFFILKATEGKSYRDAEYNKRFKQLVNSGKCVASYHFYREGVSLLQQFSHITHYVDGKNYPYILDVEERGTNWGNVFELANMLTNFYGRKPIIYTSYSMYVTNKGKQRDAYNWWIARYNKSVSRETICIGNVVMWQYDDKSSWNGREVAVDGDWFKGNYADFMRLGRID